MGARCSKISLCFWASDMKSNLKEFSDIGKICLFLRLIIEKKKLKLFMCFGVSMMMMIYGSREWSEGRRFVVGEFQRV